MSEATNQMPGVSPLETMGPRRFKVRLCHVPITDVRRPRLDILYGKRAAKGIAANGTT